MDFKDAKYLLEYKDEVWELVKESDYDFVPSLSARNSTTQSNLDDFTVDCDESNPVAYFTEMLKQEFVFAVEDKLCGFLTYIPDRELDIVKSYSPANYLSTIIVSKKSRNSGVARKMYEYFENISEGKSIVTRTWSTNNVHIHLLDSLGFTELHRVKNDRGEGVDTIYYGKKC